MAGLVHSIEELVGRTPLMELDRFEWQQQCGAHLLAKLEFFNPTGSVKDRAALSMLNAAEEAGLLKPGGTIVEQTSGNTGIGLAAFAAERGYKLDIFLERGASLERRLMLLAYGHGFWITKMPPGSVRRRSAPTPGRSQSGRRRWVRLQPTAAAPELTLTIKRQTRRTPRRITAPLGRRSGRIQKAMWIFWFAWRAPAARVLAQQVICAAATRICKWFWCSPIRTPA